MRVTLSAAKGLASLSKRSFAALRMTAGGFVILSAAKDLRGARPEILRCAQDDMQDTSQGRSREVLSPNVQKNHGWLADRFTHMLD